MIYNNVKSMPVYLSLGIIAIVIALVILWPLAVIWSLNTLFAIGIAYSFWTWLAVVVLTATFGKASVKANKND